MNLHTLKFFFITGITNFSVTFITTFIYDQIFNKKPNLLFWIILSIILILIIICSVRIWRKRYDIFFNKEIIYKNNIISLNRFDRDVIRNITKELLFYSTGEREKELTVSQIGKSIKEEYRIYFISDNSFYQEILKTLTKIHEYAFKKGKMMHGFMGRSNKQNDGSLKFVFKSSLLDLAKEVI